MDKLKLIDFDRYIITKDGNIFSKFYNRYLNPSKNTFGYAVVQLKCTDGKIRTFMRHRVIWFYFNGEIPEGYEINHKDENKMNAALDNLELTTHSENINYGTRNERTRNKQIGKIISEETKERMRNASDIRPVIQYDPQTGETIKEWKSVMHAVRTLGLKSGSNIYRACRGERRKSLGYGWRFVKTKGDEE